MIVMDASATVELLLNTRLGRCVSSRLEVGPEVALHAPGLIFVEVAQVMRRFARSGIIDDLRGAMVLLDLRQLGLQICDHDVLLDRIWQLRENLTAYDAAYVALAEALGAVLLTTDAKLARAGGHRAEIEVVSFGPGNLQSKHGH